MRSLMKGASYTLGQRASLWVSAGVVGHTLWMGAAPSMTYPIYASEWHLTPTVTAAIFAVYPLVVAVVLTSCGDVSDYVGRRVTMLLGLSSSLLGALIFAVAPNVTWLFAGRAFMGIGVGLSVGPSAAAVVEFSAAGQSKRASSITTAAQALGFASALLVGGALIEYAPLPARLSFCVLCVILGALLLAAWFLPRQTAQETLKRWQFKAPSIPVGTRKTFLVSAMAVATAYTHGAVIPSLGAQVAHDLVRSTNVLMNGAALALFAIVAGVVGILARRLSSRVSMSLGAVASTVAMILLVVSVTEHGLLLFLMATATAGVDYSLLFLGGLQALNAAAPSEHRGGTLSMLYLVAYLAMGTVASLLGVAATAWGLTVAIDLGAGAIALLCGVTVVLVVWTRVSCASVIKPMMHCALSGPRPAEHVPAFETRE
jgi:MFS family permease